jgi:hypothetical protein
VASINPGVGDIEVVNFDRRDAALEAAGLSE